MRIGKISRCNIYWVWNFSNFYFGLNLIYCYIFCKCFFFYNIFNIITDNRIVCLTIYRLFTIWYIFYIYWWPFTIYTIPIFINSNRTSIDIILMRQIICYIDRDFINWCSALPIDNNTILFYLPLNTRSTWCFSYRNINIISKDKIATERRW